MKLEEHAMLDWNDKAKALHEHAKQWQARGENRPYERNNTYPFCHHMMKFVPYFYCLLFIYKKRVIQLYRRSTSVYSQKAKFKGNKVLAKWGLYSYTLIKIIRYNYV